MDFCRQRAYPLVKACVDFYVSYATWENSAYHMLNGCAQEACSQAGAESYNLRAHNDTIYDLR
jgi:NADH:ubiquinone oxidoreductase subunit E